MDKPTVHCYDARGNHLAQIPYSSLSFKDSISDAGSMSITVPDSAALRKLDLSRITREYGSIWLAKCGARVLHAGWLTSCKVDDGGDDGNTLILVAGGGWTLWQKRLVMTKKRADTWGDGTVVIDEQHPPGDWILRLQGSYRDLCRELLRLSMEQCWVPYTLPELQGGGHVRDYNLWELATISDRLGDIADLADGPEIRFDPQLPDSTSMRWLLNVGAPEIVDHHWSLNASIPGQHIAVSAVKFDGEGMAGESFGVGGRNDDNLLIARYRDDSLESQGWPLMQKANTSHSSVSILQTLQSYVRADVISGSHPQLTIGLVCGLDRDVHVGDWIDLRVPDKQPDGKPQPLRALLVTKILGTNLWPLKVTDVSWSLDDKKQSLQCRVRW
ncbi:hypothetical protein [Bifidobacterium sp. ESL0745]|uniref:hypothetical protein n=1 Tax=Bifidobacterium sp. ESL0745 TaxID=2983226 RepID=UPI0023F858B7|nr:hypothetical protein [Bifidobacterium sp. ESL0745]MDF7665737.1 hypothetical protein [Bifidobacterium sp. ESL0745]